MNESPWFDVYLRIGDPSSGHPAKEVILPAGGVGLAISEVEVLPHGQSVRLRLRKLELRPNEG